MKRSKAKQDALDQQFEFFLKDSEYVKEKSKGVYTEKNRVWKQDGEWALQAQF